jgi:NAD(P)-dependent dehydrogenase (short-subunit alcohol dehydrogenase family)
MVIVFLASTGGADITDATDGRDTGPAGWCPRSSPIRTLLRCRRGSSDGEEPTVEGLRGKTAMVFGAGGGIGTATCALLAAEGVNVVVTSRRESTVQGITDQIRASGVECLGVVADIGDEDAVHAAVAAAVDAYGGVDFAHVNAADTSPDTIGRDTDAVSIDLEVFDRTIRTNLRGHLVCTKHVVPQFLERGGGAIVYSSSGSAFAGEPERPAYAMAKSGMHALMRHVASRWGKDNVRANVIAIGLTLTETIEKALDPAFMEQILATMSSPRLGRPDDIAGMVAFLMSSAGEWINGQVISVDGGATMR